MIITTAGGVKPLPKASVLLQEPYSDLRCSLNELAVKGGKRNLFKHGQVEITRIVDGEAVSLGQRPDLGQRLFN